MRIRSLRILPLLAVVLIGASPSTTVERLAFRIVTSAVTDQHRDVVSEIVVEGPRATDFTIALDTGPYRMDAAFLTDTTAEGAILVRTDLDTRRLYGRSERDLPLYEIDHQQHAFTLTPEEQLVLLPFGGRGSSERLEIEIVPERSEEREPDAPLAIRILRRDASGSIQVDAFRQPHRFRVDAAIAIDHRDVARGTGRVFIREPARIALEAAGPDGSHRYILVPRIEPLDHSGSMLRIRFDLLETLGGRRTRTLARDWAGVASEDGTLVYDLGEVLGSATGTSQLTLRIQMEGN